MRIRVPGQLHQRTTVVATSDLQMLQETNRQLRRRLMDKHNEAYLWRSKAARYRNFLAGALSVLLWWPFRALTWLTARRIRKNFQVPPGFASKVAAVLAFEEQRPEVAPSPTDGEGGVASEKEGVDDATEAREADPEDRREG